MFDSKAIAILLKLEVHLSQTNSSASSDNVKAMHGVIYIGHQGIALYLAMCMHPDIAYAVSVLYHFNACLGLKHWKTVKHLL